MIKKKAETARAETERASKKDRQKGRERERVTKKNRQTACVCLWCAVCLQVRETAAFPSVPTARLGQRERTKDGQSVVREIAPCPPPVLCSTRCILKKQPLASK